MKRRDYDAPEIFQECVSAISLKGRPQGLLDEWLANADVDIIITPEKKKGPGAVQAWLDCSELEELQWAEQIRDAHIQSDHFESSDGLYHLSNIERLTVIVRGNSFNTHDLEVFQLAIVNLTKLEQLHIIVASDALDLVKENLFWPGANFIPEITSISRTYRGRQKN